MGFVLAKTKFNKKDVRSFVNKWPASGDHGFNQKRFENIKAGFDKGKASGLPWEDEGIGAMGKWSAAMQSFLKAQLPFPPPECHTSYEIPNDDFKNYYKLGDVSRKNQ